MYGFFIDRLKAVSLDIYALEIYFKGKVIFHYDVENNKRYPIYSVTKSITSAAFSLACADSILTAETPLSELLPKRYKNKTTLPVKRFLTMTAGEYPFRPFGDNWLETSLSLNTDHSDTSFHYSNIPAYLVSAALENAVGEPLIKYLDRRLFEPLKINEPPYLLSPEGYFYGATGMSLSVSELNTLGRLYLKKGQWNNSCIIPSALIEEAAAPHSRTNNGDHYGYFFRVNNDHFSMVGKWGQRCMIYPNNELVVAYLSQQPEKSEELYCEMKSFVSSFILSNTLQYNL